MSEVGLTLLVLRATDPARTVAFYRALGLTLVEERHGAGPVHHAARLPGGVVLEVYPAREATRDPTRLGFTVALADALAAARALGARVVREEAGRAVVEDPDGRAVELSDRGRRSRGTIGP